MNENLSSFIAITSNLESFKEQLDITYKNHRIIYFFEDSFLVEHSKAVIKEAYIAEKDIKILVLGANSFNLVAQNSLLKILEEPPRNIVFILCVSSKTSLLPTIRSRLPLKVFSKEKKIIQTGLDFKNLSLQHVYDFLSDKKYLSKNELVDLIQAILTEAINQGVNLDENDLDIFAKLLHLASLNSRPNPLLTTSLLTILQKV